MKFFIKSMAVLIGIDLGLIVGLAVIDIRGDVTSTYLVVFFGAVLYIAISAIIGWLIDNENAI